MALPIDIVGPVRAEVFTVALRDGVLLLTGPCGADPWLIEIHGDEHPLETTHRIVDDAIDGVLLVHSTSWRWDAGAVILTFLAVVEASAVGEMDSVQIGRVGLARGTATAPPPAVVSGQVLEHALRHLAWLAKEDEVVGAMLDQRWHDTLGSYVPAPFLQLEEPPG